ncbi:iron complex outermembrane recepter protein [Acidiphilium sp. MT5]
MRAVSTRKRLVILTACSVASGMVFSTRVWAQTAPAASTTSPAGGAATPAQNTQSIQAIKVIYKKLLLREKNVAAAVSHISKQEIESAGTETSSIQSLLKQTPSVNEYQQNVGQGVPVLTVRGVRNSQLAETLNGMIPLQDLANGGQGSFLSNNIGSPITLGQLSGTTVYPGVAPPDKQGFATIGGTIAYTTKKPSAKPYAEIFGGFGSLDSSNAGFEINTGNIGKGIDAPRALLRYNQSYTAGFPDGNSIRSGNMLFDIVKPYDDGLSHLSATVIFNRADGYLATAPVPVPLMNANSYSFNFPHSLSFSKQNNKFLTVILGDHTYVNSHLLLSGKVFYLRTSNEFSSYVNPLAIYNPADPGVYPSTYPYGGSYPYQVNFQVPFFPNGPYFGPQIPLIQQNSIPLVGSFDPTGAYPNGYLPPYATYNPQSLGLTLVPGQPNGSGTATGVIEQGLNAEQSYGGSQTIGFTPRANIFLPHNDITIGGIIAKEMGIGGSAYYGSSLPIPQDSAHLVGLSAGGTQRTIYQMFAQDKINLYHDRLHIEPGFQLTGVYSSSISGYSASQSTVTPYNQVIGAGVNPTGDYKLKNFSAQIDPYIGVSFDFPDHIVAYAAYGKGARFAPTTDYTLGTASTGVGVSTTSAPKPEVVHAYNAGIRYDTSRLYLNADIYYQKLTSGFSFYTNYATGQQNYQNVGVQQFRGYELSGKYKIFKHIELFGNGSYNQAEYLNSYFAQDTPFEGQYGFVFKGDPLAGIPNWLGNFGIQYKDGPFTGRLSGQYTGQQYITFDLSPALANITSPIISPVAAAADPASPNTPLGLATTPLYPTPSANLAQQVAGLPPIQNFKLPGYLLMNLYLSYDMKVHGYHALKSVKFSLHVQNLLGLRYYQHYFLAPSESISITSPFNGFINNPSYASAFAGPPRSIYLSVSAKF